MAATDVDASRAAEGSPGGKVGTACTADTVPSSGAG